MDLSSRDALTVFIVLGVVIVAELAGLATFLFYRRANASRDETAGR